MIKKLKKKFMLLATVTIVVLMALIVASMNVINFCTVISEADETLEFLSGMADDINLPERESDSSAVNPRATGSGAVSSGAGAIDPGAQNPGGQGTVDPGAQNPGGQGTVDPGSQNPGEQGMIDPGVQNPGEQGTVDPGAQNPGGQGTVDPGVAGEDTNTFIADDNIPAGDVPSLPDGVETDAEGNPVTPGDFQGLMDIIDKNRLEERMPGGMSVEVAYESRFFRAETDGEGNILSSDLSMIATVTEEELSDYVSKAYSKSSDSGFVGRFRYLKTAGEDGYSFLFLDCGRKIDTFTRFLLISALMGLAGCVIAFVILLLCAGRIVKPMSESYEKQKTFITDAGHEIKTPLTVISANLELLRSECDDKECLDDISAQVKRLTSLTNDLVTLSKMEESNPDAVYADFPASETLQDAASGFVQAAKAAGYSLDISVAPLITLCGDSAQLSRLAGILLDNAMKYSSKGGRISFVFEKKGRNAVLSVSNPVDVPLPQADLDRLFDRFYRADKSRSSADGGHGIGLSIALSIVNTYKGSISASMSEGNIFTITAVFPV